MTDKYRMTGSVQKEERLAIIERELKGFCSDDLYEAIVHHVRTACFQYYIAGKKEK